MTPAERLAKKKGTLGKKPWGERTAKRKQVYETTLRTMRESLGLSIRHVGEGAGVAANVVEGAEQGYDLYLVNALKLAAFFGKPVEEIWTPLRQKE